MTSQTNGIKSNNGGSNGSSSASNLINSIKELQNLEEYLFSKLEEINSEETTNVTEQNDIVEHINELSDLRNGLYKELRDIYIDLDKNSQIERGALTDQLATAKIVEEQLNRLKQDSQNLVDAKVNKLRMVQIGQYEYLRYSSHRDAMKIIAFTSLWILAVSLLMKHKFIPTTIGIFVLTFILATGGVLLIIKIVDILSRDNMNYNQVGFPSPVHTSDGGGESVLQHDIGFFKQLWRGGEATADRSYNQMLSTAGKLEKQVKKAADDVSGSVENTVDKAAGIQNRNGNNTNGSTESFRVVRPAPPQRGQAYAPFN